MTNYPPPAWTFMDAKGDTADRLWLDPEHAKRQAVKTYIDAGYEFAPLEWRSVPGRGHIQEQELYFGEEPTGYRVFVQPWADAEIDDEYAWHTIRIFDDKDFWTGEPCRSVEEAHPAECGRMPRGAKCWLAHSPFRHDWPTEPGTYHIRPVYHLVQRHDGGDPDAEIELQVRTWDSALHLWFDQRGRIVPELDGAPF